MLLRNNISSIFVLDQDEALAFYTGVLGLELSQDIHFGPMRWLTVMVPGDTKMILLELPGGPGQDEKTAARVRELVAAGAGGGWLAFATDDLEDMHQRVTAADVEFTQQIVEQPYGRDFAFRDPFGNHLRIGEIRDDVSLG